MRIRIMAILTAVMALLVASTPAALAYLGPQTATSPGFVGINGQHEMGTMVPPALNRRVICIDESGGTFGFRDYPHSATSPSAEENWAAAYALSHYLDTGNDKTAAALYFYVGYVLGMNSNPAEVLRAWNAGAAAGKWADSSGQLAAIEADVNANSGPYAMDQILLSKSSGVGGVVDYIGVQSAAGVWQSGYTVTVTLNGPGVFDATGTQTMTFTSTNGPISTGFHFTSTGDVSVKQATSGLPRYVSVYPAPTGGQQRVVADAGPGDLGYEDPVSMPGWVVHATSSVSRQLMAAGSQIADTLIVRGGPGGAGWTGSVTVYGPLASPPSGGIPEGAPVLATLPIAGTFSDEIIVPVTTDPVTVPSAGYYYFQEHIDESPEMPDVAAGDWWVAYDAPLGQEVTETALVVAPTISTAVSSQQALAGSTIHDTVTIGNDPRTDVYGQPITYSVSGSLLGPVAPVWGGCTGVSWAGAATAATIAATPVPSGSSTIQVGSYSIPATAATGCYTYVATLHWAGYRASGDVSHDVGVAAETTLVTALPRISTLVSAQIVAPGTTLVDTATVSGTSPLYDYAVTGGLYGPIDAGPKGCSDIDWTVAKLIARIPATPVAGNGAVQIGAYTIPAEATVGCMSYGEQLLVMDKTTGATLATIDHPVGQVTQTTLVMAPVISTSISSQQAVEGSVLIDTVTLSGLAPIGPDGTPISYTLSGSLLGPIAPTGAGCTGLDWSTAKAAFHIPATTVAADATTAQVGQFQVKGLGCYSYVVRLTATGADGSTVEAGHPAGLVAESSLVTAGNGGAGEGGQIETGHPNTGPWLGWVFVLFTSVAGGIRVRRMS